MNSSLEKIKQERKTARQYIYVELFFIVMPFALSLFFSIMRSGFEKFSISDFSLAGAMVYGQTLFRFNGGILDYKKMSVRRFHCFGK